MKWKKFLTILFSVTVLSIFHASSFAQRGMGDTAGVARQSIHPETLNFKGKVLYVITGPCENTTGWSDLGTHFTMKAEQGGELNIHLGPAQLVQPVADMLAAGNGIIVEVFRTDKMPKGHYIAVTVTAENKAVRLRDENLRPVWAGLSNLKPYQFDSEWVNSRSQEFLSGSYRCPQARNCFCQCRRGRGGRQGWGRNCQGSRPGYGFRMRLMRPGCLKYRGPKQSSWRR